MTSPDQEPIPLRRKATRAGLDLRATYHVAGFAAMPARVVEISRIGLQLCVERKLVLGTSVDVAFDPGVAADPCRQEPTRVKVQGSVVRLVASSTSPYVYGVELRIDKETAATLQWLTLLLYATTPS